MDDWEARRPKLGQGEPLLAIDLFLRAAHLALGNDEESRQIEARLESNPARKSAFDQKPIDEALLELFSGTIALNSAR